MSIKNRKPIARKFYAGSSPSQLIYENLKMKKLGIPWSYIDFLDNIKHKNVEAASIIETQNKIEGIVAIDKNHADVINYENLHPVQTGVSEITNRVLDVLEKNKVDFDVLQLPETSNFLQYFILPIQFIGIYLLVSFLANYFRIGNMGGNGPMSILQNEKNVLDSSEIEVKFEDVAGCDEAKYELEEVVEFLKNPLKFKSAGAKIPKGVLLEGPPGTGKTLLAKAVAGEANVGFIPATGSEFIEMFVGVGASRVRKLFESAEKNKPCVIFIDEIDAVGRQRGAGFNAGNDEREQTLNQILTNMDGFQTSDGIIVLAATNRADILDSALTRAGRFDRKINVGLPDVDGREKIFNVHLKNKNYDPLLDLSEISSLTSGFSGADIANLVNEAAIYSVRYNLTKIDRQCMIDAFEKIVIGIPQKNRVKNFHSDQLVAYHEAGHTITAALFDNFFIVRKVTIQANKGGAGGYTLFTPIEYYNKYPTKEFLLANIIISLGGRAAERILFSKSSTITENYDSNKLFAEIPELKITTGASNDLKQAEKYAKIYINNFGINDKLGLLDSSNSDKPFLGRDIGSSSGLSDYSKQKIEAETQRIIEFCYNRAVNILIYNKENLKNMSDLLMNKTTIGKTELDEFDIKFKK